jgi:hypothetical protein
MHKTYICRDGTNKPICTKEKGTLGGHSRLKIYGKLDCPSALRFLAKGQYKKFRVFFEDEQTAISAVAKRNVTIATVWVRPENHVSLFKLVVNVAVPHAWLFFDRAEACLDDVVYHAQ